MTFHRLDAELQHQGLVLVRGLNHDTEDCSSDEQSESSNGAAKSAIFEVLRHLLLGSTARGIKGPQLRRQGAKGSYVGHLTLEKHSVEYTIDQTIQAQESGVTQLRRTGELISHQRSKIKTQKMISEELLGMTPQQFDSLVFISQEAQYPLVNGSGAECSAYLTTAFGLDTYDRMLDRLKDLNRADELDAATFNTADTTVQKLRVELDRLGDRSSLERSLQRQIDRSEQFATELRKLQTLALAQHKQAQDASELQRLTDRIGATPNTVVELDAEAKILRTKLNRVAERLTQAKAAAQQTKLRSNLQQRMQDVAVRLGRITDAQLTAAQKLISCYPKVHRTLQQHIQTAAEAAAPLRRLMSLGDAADCPTCGQSVDRSIMETEIAQASAAKAKLLRLREEEATQESEHLKAQQLVEQHTQLVRSKTDLTAQISMLGTHDTSVSVEELAERHCGLTRSLQEIDQKLPWLHRAQQLRELLGDLNADDSTNMALATQHNIEQTQLSLRETDTAVLHSRAQLVSHDRLTQQYAEEQVKLDTMIRLRHHIGLRTKLMRALRRLRTRRIHDIVVSLQRTVAPYVEAMFGAEQITIEVDDQNPESIERYATKPHPRHPGQHIRLPLRALSKGERAKLRVAFIWAIRRLMRPDRTTNILVLDEADSGLDRRGLKAYGGLLDSLRHEYESVFVITHRSEIASLQFDKIWTVEKRDGTSRLCCA